MKLNYIAGKWVAGESSTRNINPANTKDIIGEYTKASVDQVNEAVAAAKTAFASWSVSNIQARSEMLDRIGKAILARKEELGELLAREEGKSLPEAIGEVGRAAQVFQYFSGEVLQMRGDYQPSIRPGLDIQVSREALGVIGIITPWNFPTAIPAWKIAPALAYGNCVVFKPAELVPASAHALAEIIVEAGVPEGVFNLVMGAGRSVGETIINHKDIAGISFTGSQGIGQHIAVSAAKRMAKIQLEMGGKNPLVILDDADLNQAVDVAINGAFFSTGQRCTASSRIIVTEGIYDAFIKAFEERTRALVVGDPLKADTQIGPVSSESQFKQNLEYVNSGLKEGATLIYGGEAVTRDTHGYFMTPAIFTEVRPDMRICREEIFGPVACVLKVKSYEEALVMANDTEFGLSSGICTQSLKYASHFKQHSQAGMVMVNVPTAGVDYHVPFGGRKGSSFGSREQGSYAREFYTSVKTSYTLA